MLHELVVSNRNELIRRCKAMASRRMAPGSIPSATDHGVPLFLQQLVDTLREESSTAGRSAADPAPAPADTPIGRTAALHGARLLAQGYRIDQVVHDYGDVCQAVTELALEQRTPIATGEFRTLNRCLDDAIADAVTAYGHARQLSSDLKASDLRDRQGALWNEQRRLVDIALHAQAAIKTGNIGVLGATGALLAHTLERLRALADRAAAAQPAAP